LGKQGFLDDHQVGQSEQGVQLRHILLEAAVAQLLVPEQELSGISCAAGRLNRSGHG
jgi:hypothetical protein